MKYFVKLWGTYEINQETSIHLKPQARQKYPPGGESEEGSASDMKYPPLRHQSQKTPETPETPETPVAVRRTLLAAQDGHGSISLPL